MEFRVAGFLSKDKQVYKDVKNDVDVHQYTADTMNVSRQDAKAHTFKPLYGGILGTLLDCHSNWAAAWYMMNELKLEEEETSM